MRNISKEMSGISDGRKVSKMKYKFLIPFVVAAMAVLLSPPLASAVLLGSDLASFAVLGASTVTNIPTSTIVGNVGVWSSEGANAITGFGDTTQVTGGTLQAGTAPAQLAQGQLTTARNNLGNLGAGTPLGVNLAGLTIFPGVYTVPEGTTNLSGTVTLDGLGNPNAFWLFQMPGTLITSDHSTVDVTNVGTGTGAVFWNVGSSATINSFSTFEGNILALTSIGLKTGAIIDCGRALANNGAVTMDTNTINSIGCGGTELAFVTDTGGTVTGVVDSGGTVVSGGGPAPAPIPEPGTMMLLGSGLVGLVGWGRKKLRK